MSPVLTAEQLQAIHANPNNAVRAIDPESNESYVIVRADVFEKMQQILNDDYRLSDTYVAQIQSAMRAGWSDPAMDDYNNYDDNYQKLCH